MFDVQLFQWNNFLYSSTLLSMYLAFSPIRRSFSSRALMHWSTFYFMSLQRMECPMSYVYRTYTNLFTCCILIKVPSTGDPANRAIIWVPPHLNPTSRWPPASCVVTQSLSTSWVWPLARPIMCVFTQLLSTSWPCPRVARSRELASGWEQICG